MQTNERSLLIQIAVLVLICSGLLVLTHEEPAAHVTHNAPVATTTGYIEPVANAPATSTLSPTTTATTTPRRVAQTATVAPSIKKSSPEATSTPKNDKPGTVSRIDHPYTTVPLSFDEINVKTRAALVNIMCLARNGSLVRPISGSGTIIDPRGIILTNAHVAQYVLLAQDGRIGLDCSIRTGSPATAQWVANVLYIPPVWVETHAADILLPHPLGTGEHDFALLYVTAALPGSQIPSSFPYLPVDTREAIAFVDDPVLVAGYPAEYLGAQATTNDLFSASSITSVKQLLTFSENSVDALSLGGVIQAQSGSSGGAVVNPWGRLVGVITTTSNGATTAERDLRAVSLYFINRDLKSQSGTDLNTLLASDPAALTADFGKRAAPDLAQMLIAQILKAQSH